VKYRFMWGIFLALSAVLLWLNHLVPILGQVFFGTFFLILVVFAVKIWLVSQETGGIDEWDEDP